MTRAPLAPLLLAALLLAALLLTAAAPPARSAATDSDSIRFAVRYTSANQVGLTISNYGFFGNSFTSRSPSFEFPVGSGDEHMARGGLWVGAIALADTGAFTGVSAAITDATQGASGAGNTEFTPADNAILERSRILNSRNYSPDAVSDQDFVALYSDQPGGSRPGQERHTPLKILVRQNTLSFQLPAADAFVINQFTIVNQGPPLRNAWVGMYAQLVSGNKDNYSTWPPAASSGPGSWYYRSQIAYDRARRIYMEHFCAGPSDCLASAVPPWVGVQLLRVSPGTIADKQVHLHWWTFSAGDATRDEDTEKYALLSTEDPTDPGTCVPGGGACSPIGLVSVGPFASIAPGDSIRVDFAFVGGLNDTLLRAHADYAQFSADIDYRLPSPPPSPRVLVETGSQRVDLWWEDSPESAVDPASQAPGGRDFEGYRVYLGLDRAAPRLVAQYDKVDTTGFNTGFAAVQLANPRVVNGVTYRYHMRITGLQDGFPYWGAVTSYDTGDQTTPSLESGVLQNKFLAVPNAAPGESPVGVTVFPNPYRVETGWDHGQLVRDHFLWFAGLPRRCVLRVFTLAGDRVLERRLDGSAGAGTLARGVYNPVSDTDTGPPALSGGAFAWDLITDRGQAAATGLYVWVVENLDGGALSRGKMLIVKSDREP